MRELERLRRVRKGEREIERGGTERGIYIEKETGSEGEREEGGERERVRERERGGEMLVAMLVM